MRAIKLLSLAVPLGLLGACTPTVPPELANARRAYGQAATGAAATNAPAELHKAKESLSYAERAFEESPSAQSTLDLAYIAERKAQEAEAVGQTEQARRIQMQAEQAYSQAQSQLIGQTKGQLQQTREQLAMSDLERAQAQQAAKEAEAKLAKVASVKQDERGLVITLTGSVLFASDQSTLLPSAERRLDQVAQALLANKERKLVIEGYTDSRGSDSHNMDLSRRRADAVRAYLVSRGYDGALVFAEGLGEARPVADNSTAEGRANNRRVEIIVKQKGD